MSNEEIRNKQNQRYQYSPTDWQAEVEEGRPYLSQKQLAFFPSYTQCMQYLCKKSVKKMQECYQTVQVIKIIIIIIVHSHISMKPNFVYVYTTFLINIIWGRCVQELQLLQSESDRWNGKRTKSKKNISKQFHTFPFPNSKFCSISIPVSYRSISQYSIGPRSTGDQTACH